MDQSTPELISTALLQMKLEIGWQVIKASTPKMTVEGIVCSPVLLRAQLGVLVHVVVVAGVIRDGLGFQAAISKVARFQGCNTQHRGMIMIVVITWW